MEYGNIKLRSALDANSQNITGAGNLIESDESTRTVNFDSGMSTSTIQALIDAEDKHIGNDQTLTFQFADGTYTIGQLLFDDFFGNGRINIQGNSGESGQHTNQAVIIDQSNHAIKIKGVRVNVCSVKNIRFNIDQSVSGFVGVLAEDCTRVDVIGCYFNGNSIVRGYGIFCNEVRSATTNGCLFTQSIFAIFYKNTWGGSQSNDDTGTLPAFGLQSEGGTLIKRGGTQISGSSANETTASGGLIR